jgi:hypothetical protein
VAFTCSLDGDRDILPRTLSIYVVVQIMQLDLALGLMVVPCKRAR